MFYLTYDTSDMFCPQQKCFLNHPKVPVMWFVCCSPEDEPQHSWLVAAAEAGKGADEAAAGPPPTDPPTGQWPDQTWEVFGRNIGVRKAGVCLCTIGVSRKEPGDRRVRPRQEHADARPTPGCQDQSSEPRTDAQRVSGGGSGRAPFVRNPIFFTVLTGFGSSKLGDQVVGVLLQRPLTQREHGQRSERQQPAPHVGPHVELRRSHGHW